MPYGGRGGRHESYYGQRHINRQGKGKEGITDDDVVVVDHLHIDVMASDI